MNLRREAIKVAARELEKGNAPQTAQALRNEDWVTFKRGGYRAMGEALLAVLSLLEGYEELEVKQHMNLSHGSVIFRDVKSCGRWPCDFSGPTITIQVPCGKGKSDMIKLPRGVVNKLVDAMENLKEEIGGGE